MLHLTGGFSFYGLPTVRRDQAARAAIRVWLQDIKDEMNISAIKLAELAGTSANTIYRALDVEGEFMPSMTTLTKVSQKLGRPLPTIFAPQSQVTADHIRPYNQGLVPENPSNFIMLTAEQDRQFWRVNDRALELEGYMPGDFVLVDPSVKPATGDVVCASVASQQNKAEETVLRLYEAPYLLSRSMDRSIDPAPILVDRSVHIIGTAVQLLRAIKAAS